MWKTALHVLPFWTFFLLQVKMPIFVLKEDWISCFRPKWVKVTRPKIARPVVSNAPQSQLKLVDQGMSQNNITCF